MLKTGISIYLSSGIEKNEEVIRKAKEAGATYGFTSLHIPEEDYVDYKKSVRQLLDLTNDAKIELMIDVDGETPERLGLKRMEDLLDYGVTSIRLDYGFSDKEIVALSKHFNIVWNASTTSPFDIRKWKSLGADTSRFTACHNYYPKPYTGLNIGYVRDINFALKLAGYQVTSFVPGDNELRGPLKLGLPTIEEHRGQKESLAINMLELYKAKSDIVMVGDVNLSDNGWKEFKAVSDGVINLRAVLREGYTDLYDRVAHERPDSSAFVIRAEESRGWYKNQSILPENTIDCEVGSICIGNDKYLRYKGELEICRKLRRSDEKVNVIGEICKEDLKYIPFIENGMGFKLVAK